MERKNSFDPRTKLLIILCISLLALFCSDLRYLSILFAVTAVLVLWICGRSLFLTAVRKLRGIFLLFGSIAVIQSLFTTGAHPLITVGPLHLLSVEGLLLGVSFLLRILTIMLAAVLIASESQWVTVQGLIQCGLPYEVAFMCALAVRSIPMFGEEFRNILISIQLRGVDLKRVPFGKRIRLYAALLMPVVAGMLERAKTMAMVMEMRGFRAYEKRSSYLTLAFRKRDWALMLLTVLLTAAALLCYVRGI